jgi:ubiquinone/menaquinone biosynthesis C-methylase UbiE
VTGTPPSSPSSRSDPASPDSSDPRPSRGLNSSVTRFWSFAAPLYDAPFLQQFVYRPPQTEVIEELVRRGSRRVADVACGTGILADRIQREADADEVFGVDLAEGMLAQARERSDQVTWLTGSAERLPFETAGPGSGLDAVVTTSAFHFFDQPAALAEFHRVLAPGGIVAVGTFSPWQPLPLQRLSAGRMNPAHNPSAAEVRALFAEAGFELAWQRRVHRPLITSLLSDYVTVGVKPEP